MKKLYTVTVNDHGDWGQVVFEWTEEEFNIINSFFQKLEKDIDKDVDIPMSIEEYNEKEYIKNYGHPYAPEM